jgi:hypothetical protein
MLINEVTNIPLLFLATVRVVLRGSSMTTRTTISADNSSNAFAMLTRFYGVGNVLSLSQIVSEAPQSDQIQREAASSPFLMSAQAQPRKVAQIQPSQVQQQRKRRVSATPIADPIKHQRIQNILTKQFMRRSNIVSPTLDDVRIAKNRAQTAQKRADLDFKNVSKQCE